MMYRLPGCGAAIDIQEPLMQFRIRRKSPWLVFCAPDVADHVSVTRAEACKDYGYNLTTFGFRRDRYSSAGGLGGDCILLGQTQEGRYVHRILALLKALPKQIGRAHV